jgi:nicotinic acid phosphoribosyltransferase
MALNFDKLMAIAAAKRLRMGEAAWEQLKKEEEEEGRALIKKTLDEIASFRDSPEGRAQTAFKDELKKMQIDPVINQSVACLEIIEALLQCLRDARYFEDDALNILHPLGKPLEAKEMKRRGGMRYAKNKEPKLFVQSEWLKHKEAYENNKTDFVEKYRKRVWNEYEVKITEKQMREVWLKGL